MINEQFDKNYQILLIKIGHNLEAHRTLSGLSIESVAKELHIEEHLLKSVEKGDNVDYSLGLLLKLSILYQIDLKDLF